MNIAELCAHMVAWLQEHVRGAGARGAVIGLSGGLDSAVVAALCKRAFPHDTWGVTMPCDSVSIDAEYSKTLARQLDIHYVDIDLTGVWQNMVAAIEAQVPPAAGPPPTYVRANIKPRLRMATLYYIAARHNLLVIGTENKPELALGYSTKYGDAGVDLMPLANLLKREVWQLAEYLNVPREIIDRPPTAGLWADQTDEKEMGLTYEQIDAYLLHGDGDPHVVETIQRLHQQSEHKRRMPPHGPRPKR